MKRHPIVKGNPTPTQQAVHRHKKNHLLNVLKKLFSSETQYRLILCFLGSTSTESSVSSASSASNRANSNNKTVLAGSVSYIVSANASSEGQEETGHDAHSTSSIDTILAQIKDPIELAENTDHLEEIDSTIPVSLNNVAVSFFL